LRCLKVFSRLKKYFEFCTKTTVKMQWHFVSMETALESMRLHM
jgi:hypothetical protein